ncbi:MAG: hypothetical protein DWQ34_02010 [Planctomycetota bacterium]|nr:MAG: hypothetical protein DWQ34_02010 [Planctomycetota bacterium]REK20999.1 MAG: hypothetical protein DWQ41_23440 [Planctomycetota bacterium]REK37220.1 MAG: hypothetical protein DWQ45_07150 [Planctomycetota bacterium]
MQLQSALGPTILISTIALCAIRSDDDPTPPSPLLEDHFSNAKPGESPEAAGWSLDTSRGNSTWVVTEDATCRVTHAVKPYAQDTLRRSVELPQRYYMDFEARFPEHAGFSLVAASGRTGTAFYGSGKTILWKVLPNKALGFGWQTVPVAIRSATWHKYRILVDIDEELQAFYVDEMSQPLFRETGRDMRLQPDPEKPAANYVEFRDYGLVTKPVTSEFRNVKVVALKPGETPPNDSFTPAELPALSGPSPAELWRDPGQTDHPHPDGPFVVTSEAELFLDDYLIAETQNLSRRLNKPEPHPDNPLLRGSAEWEHNQLAFPSVYRIDGQLRMWYLSWGWNYAARDGEVPIRDSSFLCYATSTDGIHWQRPVLGLVEFQGSTRNNIVLRHDGSHFDSFSVFYHPQKEDPFRMLIYQGRWPYDDAAIKAKGYEFKIKEHGHFPFRSVDGLHWEYIQDDPDPVWGSDRSSAAYDSRRDKYMGFWKSSYQGVRSRMYAESDDLLEWTPATRSLTPQWMDDPDSQVDPPGTHYYGMVAFPYGNQYVGLLEVLDDLTSCMHFRVISSRDLKTWNQMSAPEPFIDHGDDGSWNSGIQMMANSPPVLLDDKLWFFYDGADYDHSGGDRTGKQRCIGVSALSKDRFVSLAPADASYEAALTTVPLQLDGKALHINADATGGELRVELLTIDGDVLPGYSRKDCRPIADASSLDATVAFNGQDQLPEDPVRIHFILDGAKLSAFWVE